MVVMVTMQACGCSLRGGCPGGPAEESGLSLYLVTFLPGSGSHVCVCMRSLHGGVPGGPEPTHPSPHSGLLRIQYWTVECHIGSAWSFKAGVANTALTFSLEAASQEEQSRVP